MTLLELLGKDSVLDSYAGDVWRVVESQEETATLSLVDDMHEQALLEEMIDQVKPKYRQGTENLHYLLRTAFRYPPLKWGSRFGTQAMPSYLYGSEQISTALAECAYYRLLFMEDMDVPPTNPIRSLLCVFSFELNTEGCLDLLHSRFEPWYGELTSETNYSATHAIGRWAQDAGECEIIRFASARARDGINIAVKEPSALSADAPKAQQPWVCLVKQDSVSFASRASTMTYVFAKSGFSEQSGSLRRVSA